MIGQFRCWILTIPQHLFTPYLNSKLHFITGQLERGEETGYLHWQVYVHAKRSLRLAALKKLFGQEIHAEATRSSAAIDYCSKLETRIEGTHFRIGEIPLKRNSKIDWDLIRTRAKEGAFEEIPSDVFIKYHSQVKHIYADNLTPVAFERQTNVYWGNTGLGKSRTAWEEAGIDAYPKIPSTKFWDGYRGQSRVIIDEFTGQISIEHLLRWLDRYPVIVEVKGSATVLLATHIWITSNIDPANWYPGAPESQRQALARRMKIKHFLPYPNLPLALAARETLWATLSLRSGLQSDC